MSLPRPTQNGTLLGVALLVAVQIPASIEHIQNPTVKALVQILALLAVIWAALRVDASSPLTLRPPPAPSGGGRETSLPPKGKA